MEKKNGLLTAALLLAGVLTSGCSDDNQYGGSPAEPGSPVLFSVASGGSDTRTIYESNLQINWVEGDLIGICSPSANVEHVTGAVNVDSATYKVEVVNADGHPHHAKIVPAYSNKYLTWGSDLETPATFYGAYPAERIVTYPDENSAVFSMKYYTNQECKVYSSENGEYLTNPDMKNAYMIAKNELQPIGDHVLLSFDPIMTTPDITITAGSYEVGTGIIQPVTVTGVSVIMPKKLSSSDLNYNITGLTNGSITAPRGELKDIVDGQESVFIQIDNGGKKYVDLYEGESINLMAFLPPIPNLTGAKIQVHTLGTTFVIKVEEELKAQSRITIKLPDITPETTKPNNWISRLDGNTSLKSMSIPAYVCKGTETPDDIEDLFKKGVRAFDAEKFAKIEDTGLLEWTKILNADFSNKISSLITDENNLNEFVIVWVDNTDHAGGIQNPNKDKWINFPNSIKDAKGKVVFLEKHSVGKFTNINNSVINDLFGSKSITNSIEFLDSEKDWKAQFIDLDKDSENNKAIYNQIVTYKEQSGCTGIVTIPNAENSFDSSYGDLLLQAVIDCNFKLRCNSKSNQQ